MLQNVSRLKIMFLTDIHLNHSAIDKLESWVLEHYNTQPNFDYCLIGGDTANCDYSKNSHNQEEMHNQTNLVLKRIKSMLGCKLLFIPGNHDCQHLYQDQKKNDIFINIHNKVVELSEGLQILGFGGSTPAYQVKNLNDPHEELFWTGYPYHSEGDLRKQWEKGNFTKIFEGWQKNNADSQLIMLTHIGPKLSSTAADTLELFPDFTISTGSQFLNKMCQFPQIACWIHGHSHKGSKYAMYGNLPIMNPGAIKHGQFMYFQMIKDDKKWKLGSKSFQNLL